MEFFYQKKYYVKTSSTIHHRWMYIFPGKSYLPVCVLIFTLTNYDHVAYLSYITPTRCFVFIVNSEHKTTWMYKEASLPV